jgi:hypothetical protein
MTYRIVTVLLLPIVPELSACRQGIAAGRPRPTIGPWSTAGRRSKRSSPTSVTDPAGRFDPPGDDERQSFRNALTRYVGRPVARRDSGGKDIPAACGTLAGAGQGLS